MTDVVEVASQAKPKIVTWEENLQVARKACVNLDLVKAEHDVKDLQCRLKAAEDIATAKRLSRDNEVFVRGELVIRVASKMAAHSMAIVALEVVEIIRDWIKRGSEVMPDAVAALFGVPDHVRSLEFAHINLIAHEVGDNVSHGRDNDVDWDTADETWLVDGWQYVDDVEVRTLMLADLVDTSLGTPSDAEELGRYRHSRYIEFDDVVLLRNRLDYGQDSVKGSRPFEYSRSKSTRPLSELKFTSIVDDAAEEKCEAEGSNDVQIVEESAGRDEKRRKIE